MSRVRVPEGQLTIKFIVPASVENPGGTFTYNKWATMHYALEDEKCKYVYRGVVQW